MPTVSLVCEGFERQASATGRGLGFDGMALAVLKGHVDSQPTGEMLSSLLATTIDEVIKGLTCSIDLDREASTEPTALEVVASGTIDHIVELFADRGWSDGLPIVPPTRDRVERFLEAGGYDPWRSLGIARPSGRDMTLWSIAVNAVMAGCRAEQMPVVIALAEVLADPGYGVEHSGNTTGADALIVLNGPCAAELGFVSGPGALRDGNQANTSVGRWLRLYLRNVCGFTYDQHDKGTFGNSSRVVLAEHEETLRAIDWPPLSADFGFAAGDDVVSVARMNSGIIVGSVFGSAPPDIIPYLADGLVRASGWELTHVCGLGRGDYRPLLILSPNIARTFAKAGWSKDDVRNALYDAARLPAWKFEKLIGEWSNLTTGRRLLTDMAASGDVPADFALSNDPDRLVPIVTAPDKILIAVAGDPNRANAFVFSNDGPHGQWTAKAVDRTMSQDLMCRVDGHP